MGIYINTADGKENWLRDNAAAMYPHSHGLTYEQMREKGVPVCLVDNGPFTAAAVADCKREYEAFAQEDGRPKLWFSVPLASLKPILSDFEFESIEPFETEAA